MPACHSVLLLRVPSTLQRNPDSDARGFGAVFFSFGLGLWAFWVHVLELPDPGYGYWHSSDPWCLAAPGEPKSQPWGAHRFTVLTWSGSALIPPLMLRVRAWSVGLEGQGRGCARRGKPEGGRQSEGFGEARGWCCRSELPGRPAGRLCGTAHWHLSSKWGGRGEGKQWWGWGWCCLTIPIIPSMSCRAGMG